MFMKSFWPVNYEIPPKDASGKRLADAETYP